MRIYLLRNEYVHSSNINARDAMNKIKLKRILSDFLDLFLKSLNLNMKSGNIHLEGKDIFIEYTRRYSAKKTTLNILKGNHKVLNQRLSYNNLQTKLNKSDILLNILLDRIKLLNGPSIKENISNRKC